MAKRYTINDISGVRESYRANPSTTAGVGQVVFALYTAGTQTLMGQCTSGSNLIPWGIRCSFVCGQQSACSTSACTTNSFSFGQGTYVALGSVGDCGATLWRRIS